MHRAACQGGLVATSREIQPEADQWDGNTWTTVTSFAGITPWTWLVDVRQRVAHHLASRVDELTPRLWKAHWVDQPLGSDVDT